MRCCRGNGARDMESSQKALMLDTLKQFGSVTVRAHGQSMRPFIHDGDQVVIHKPSHPPSKGFVIVFFLGQQMCIKRLQSVHCSENGQFTLIIKGDSSPCSKATILFSECIGIVDHTIHNGKTKYFWFSRPGRILSLPIGAVLRTLIRLKTGLLKKN
jgi:signal peptidase I